ncbi:hypothetical protein [Rhodococcoides corynebacterioides]|uniref:hypothetical protein n=1 Tax=Rhodococcoides corynebacterioides TaxID=53972 RepID=UPI0021BE405D|nr:hypothetical protein [Rhodococcus corynebacterioides]
MATTPVDRADTADGGGARRRGRSAVRSAHGTSAVESFVIVAVATILITRAYLEITDYPQVGNGTLHIAHALWGGAGMMAALVIGWLFLGYGARVVAVVLGGIGFGLFLDEVGKFVTRDNDYFYGPASEIMYVTIVAVLVATRVLRDAAEPSPRECLANAAAIAADGVAGGLPAHRREKGLELLDRARLAGADPDVVAGLDVLLRRSAPASAGAAGLRVHLRSRLPRWVTSPRWVPVLAWLMVITSVLGVIGGVLALVTGGVDVATDDLEVTVERMTVSGGILWVTACITVALGLPAVIALHRTRKLWPLRWLRVAALVYALLGALVDFAQIGFAALSNLAIGLVTLAAISHRLAVRTAEGSARTRSDAVRL